MFKHVACLMEILVRKCKKRKQVKTNPLVFIVNIVPTVLKPFVFYGFFAFLHPGTRETGFFFGFFFGLLHLLLEIIVDLIRTSAYDMKARGMGLVKCVRVLVTSTGQGWRHMSVLPYFAERRPGISLLVKRRRKFPHLHHRCNVWRGRHGDHK